MKYKHLHIFNGFIFIILFAINLFIYKNRDDGYAYKELQSTSPDYSHYNTFGNTIIKLHEDRKNINSAILNLNTKR